MRRFIFVIVVGAFFYSRPVSAHDPKYHHEKGIQGTVEGLKGQNLTLTTTDGSKEIAIMEETKIEIGNKAGDQSNLTHGTHVTVFTTKLPSGQLAAKEVHIEEGTITTK